MIAPFSWLAAIAFSTTFRMAIVAITELPESIGISRGRSMRIVTPFA